MRSAREKCPAPGGRRGGGGSGEGREEPRRRERFQREEGRAAGVENSRQEAACRQHCPPTRPRSAASRLPRIPLGEPVSLSLLPSSPALYKSPAPADPPTAGDPGTLAPGAGSRRRLRTAGTLRSRRGPLLALSLARFPPASSLRNRGARMSEKRVEEAPAELSAKERKEKKEKLEEKAVHKEKKKEIVEDEENGADEDDEENPDDVDEEEGGDEDEEGDENGQEQDGHAEKRSAEEEEDEVDPKRQKTENGSSA
ncbi:parathymosin [Aphelocoma coerulescens]|uniref:parathymosin n=1 Tax=Aphelocoma coerulescens TaxID=39617 RepID=UPI003604A233